MHGRYVARAWRRFGVPTALALLALGQASRVGAQADVPLGARHVLGTSPDLPLRAVGDVALCRAFDCQRTLSAALARAPSARWMISVEGSAGRSVVQPTSPLSTDGSIHLFYGTDARQVWIGRGAGRPRGIDSAGSGLNRWMEYGASLRWRSVSVAVDIGAGSQPTVEQRSPSTEKLVYQTVDSSTGALRVDTVTRFGSANTRDDRARWSSTAVRLAWLSEQWRLGTVIGRASSQTGRPIVWSTTEAERRIGRSLAFVASLGTYPGSLASNAPRSRWMLGAGLTAAIGRLSHAPAPSPAPTPAAQHIVAIRVSPGLYRFVLHLPTADRVELAADFTGWRPVAMRRDVDDTWAAEVPASPGTHRVSVRFDDGTWEAPPGLVAESDDFGGSAGVIIVP